MPQVCAATLSSYIWFTIWIMLYLNLSEFSISIFQKLSVKCFLFASCAAAEGQMDCLLLLVNQEHSADIFDSLDTEGQ